MTHSKPCTEHQYREVEVYWEQSTGKLWQKLECERCGRNSWAWTKPDIPVFKISKETLFMMDEAIRNLRDGRISGPVDLEDD